MAALLCRRNRLTEWRIKMDAATEKHFKAWLDNHELEEYRERTERGIRELLDADPDLLLDHSWSELRDMAL